jgi:type IV pilus assembly protein PilY1
MRWCIAIALVCTLLGINAALADDIEAYLPGGEAGDVYLHIVMDLGNGDLDTPLCTYGVNCGPPFMTEAAHRHLADMYLEGETVTAPGIFKAVLAAVLENTLFDDIQVALLISNHPDNRPDALDTRSGGGTILRGYRQLREQRAQFTATLKSTPVLASANAHELQPKETYFEWMRYIQGGDVALGQNTRGNFGRADPVPDYAADIIANGSYLTPFTEQSACPRLYSILFTLGVSTRDEDLNAPLAAQTTLPNPASIEELLAYLHNDSTDLLPQLEATVPLQKTWVVSSRGRSGNAARQAEAAGGGILLYVNEPQELQLALTRALTATSTVVGTSLDATFLDDAFHRGQLLDQVFVPMFSPQAGGSGLGNLKKLALRRSGGGGMGAGGDGVSYQLIDARGNPALEVTGDDKGKLRMDALTFWTDPAALPPGDGDEMPDHADGGAVTRGGAGQKIDGFVGYSTDREEAVEYFIGDTNTDTPSNGYPPRQLFYEPQSGQEFAPLDANATTLAALRPLIDPDGELTDEAMLNQIRRARGQDVDNGKTSARGWLLGRVMHSRPVALNYGATAGYSKENPNIRLLFGSGEGIFHVLENTDIAGNESGREVFGFYPREMLANMTKLTDERTAASLTDYGVDGAPVVLKIDKNGDGTLDYAAGDEAYVYFGLRRGGSSYYALDISNPAAVPRLVWKISATAGGAFDELGLTFSTPVVGKVNYGGVPVDVVIFAGGYNGGWNEDYSARRGKDLGAADDTAGNAIYIVNARTGALIWKAVQGATGVRSNTQYAHAGLVDSIPSAVAALVTPAGIIDRLYVGDTGGAVWRVDLPPGAAGDEEHRRNHWMITKLADLGSDAGEPGGTASDDRRFFHAPDIVRTYDSLGSFDGVLIQSGNREDPNETVVGNALFYIKDRETTTGSPHVRSENDVGAPAGRFQYADLPDQSTCVAGAQAAGDGDDAGTCANRRLEFGWQARFDQPGEKGLSTPLTDGGRVFASTFVPGEPTACSGRRGRGRLHVLSLTNATAVANQQRYYELGPGIPADVMSLGDTILLPGGGIDLHDLDGDGARDTSKFLPSQAGKLYRTYWREPGADPL